MFASVSVGDSLTGEPDMTDATIRELEADHRYDRVTHLTDDTVAAVFRANWTNSTTYVVVTTDNRRIAVAPYDDRCPCGNNETTTIRRGTPAQTAQQQRRSARCQHASFVRECEDIGPCDECGSWTIAKTDHEHPDRRIDAVILTEVHCANCGTSRSTL